MKYLKKKKKDIINKVAFFSLPYGKLTFKTSYTSFPSKENAMRKKNFRQRRTQCVKKINSFIKNLLLSY